MSQDLNSSDDLRGEPEIIQHRGQACSRRSTVALNLM